MVATVSEIEGAAPKPTVNYVQMDIGAGEPLTIEPPRSFTQLLSEIAAVDTAAQPSRHQRVQQAPKPAPAPFQPLPPEAVAPQLQQKKEGKPWKMPGLRMPTKQKANQAAAPPQQAPQVQEGEVKLQPVQAPQAKPLEISAAEELTNALKASSIAPQEAPVQQVTQPAKNLVLPKLSLSDQFDELDKIIENVK
jgi:hypothetical protein